MKYVKFFFVKYKFLHGLAFTLLKKAKLLKRAWQCFKFLEASIISLEPRLNVGGSEPLKKITLVAPTNWFLPVLLLLVSS